MSNIFQAMLYRIMKSKIAVYSLICCIIFGVLFSIVAMNAEDTIQGIYGTMDNMFYISNLIFLVFVCAYNCSDYKNKTINYEVMNGHSSWEIFLGRLLAFVLCIEIMFHLELLVIHLILSRVQEYSIIISQNGNYLLRILTLDLVVLAYAVYYVVCSFVARKMIAGILFSWLGFAISGLVVTLNSVLVFENGTLFAALVGANSMKYIMLGGFSVWQSAVTVTIALIFIIMFLVIGLVNVNRQEY